MLSPMQAMRVLSFFGFSGRGKYLAALSTATPSKTAESEQTAIVAFFMSVLSSYPQNT
jgi:hypothetical protein